MDVSGRNSSLKFSSTLSRGGAEDFDLFCKQCDRDDIRLPAFGYCVDCEAHLCHTCFNTHRKPKSLSHHKLLDKDHMPNEQNPDSSSKCNPAEYTGDLSKPCAKHIKEVIKYYCHDHQAIICSVCVTLEHTPTSCHVEYIPNISGQTLSSHELKETLQDIVKLTEKCCQMTKEFKQRLTKSTTSLTSAIAEIGNFRKEINKRLDELERELRDTAATIKDDNNEKLKTAETTCDKIQKSLQASADALQHLNTDKKADQLFIELKTAQQIIKDNEEKISKLPAVNDVDVYFFERNQAFKKFLQDKKSLGILNSKKLKRPAQSMTKDSLSMKFSIDIKIKSAMDDYDCGISGVAVSPPNKLFVVDYINRSIKMIDIKNGVIKRLRLESDPWDITIINKDTLAVTLRGNKIVQFISFSSNSLSLKHNLKVDGECHGISHYQGKLVVTFFNPAKLITMDMKGNTDIMVNNNSKGDIFRSPSYVTSNSVSIYVSDSGRKAVIWLNWLGEMLGIHKGIKQPRGNTLLTDGSLLVSDCYGNCINRVSGDCEDKEIILESVNSPYAICWCAETMTLYVSACIGYGTTKNNNYIKVFTRK